MGKYFIIYKFTNKINGKSYIGQTNRGFKTRKQEHIALSKIDSKFKFHQAIRKYGIDNFIDEILEFDIKTKSESNCLEIKYILEFDTYVNGYNMTKGGGNRGSFKHNEESKIKMRESHIGKVLSNEHKESISLANKGVKKSKEHVEKVRQANIGKIISKETRKLISDLNKGKFSGCKNPAAIIVNIYDSNNILKYECFGNFEMICKNNDLPIKALRMSYYSNGKPIYTGQSNKQEVLDRYGNYIGWYAVKLTK